MALKVHGKYSYRYQHVMYESIITIHFYLPGQYQHKQFSFIARLHKAIYFSLISICWVCSEIMYTKSDSWWYQKTFVERQLLPVQINIRLMQHK